MSIHVEATPNPNAMKFTTDSLIFEGNSSISVMPGQTSEHKILNDLMAIESVDNVFGYQNFITVNKKADVEWDNLTPQVKDILNTYGY
ncbi:NifU N-terminal domain-containing protein [Aquibacillus koreensis]|uniref:NifU N-terminal domain-containing protein n=1 Tax=Aquibacillus koreensis TaxID=279446 RepID=A0A9X3WMR4_9BACI|nr:NifU N-terminal domain-containing protein [Aquibacillus koreensis]MCT2535621.1 NifU N-terminal domain-containing protein [Aquibacillus koreensis]MDC3420094.1 NifU N-terminal domain-containing protein [Aquibacillus koreensis]